MKRWNENLLNITYGILALVCLTRVRWLIYLACVLGIAASAIKMITTEKKNWIPYIISIIFFFMVIMGNIWFALAQ